MRRLADGLAACASAPCAGSLEVREMTVPGWNDTGVGAAWPPFTRVVHQKFIVGDRAANQTGLHAATWFYGISTFQVAAPPRPGFNGISASRPRLVYGIFKPEPARSEIPC